MSTFQLKYIFSEHVSTFQPIVYGNVSKYFGKKREEDGHTHQVIKYFVMVDISMINTNSIEFLKVFGCSLLNHSKIFTFCFTSLSLTKQIFLLETPILRIPSISD